MYPLDRGVWGPISRITHLRDELLRIVDLDLVDGNRGRRRVALARYAASGRLRGLDGVYVESSTFLPAEADIAFLGLARALGIPVITYVRDAYQLFDDYGTGSGLRGWVGRALFRPAIRALRAVSTRLAFPTNGLARAVLGDSATDAVLLPPGAPAPFDVPMAPDARRLLFVGDARLPSQGADRLIRSVGVARDAGMAVELTVVCRPGQEPPGPRPAWLRIERAEGVGIAALLSGVVATVIPRPRNPYNDLALPIKLFDYLAYGRPLLVTDCVEQAAIVRDADCGVVTDDSVDALVAGIGELLAADDATRSRWSANAVRAAEHQSWGRRAARIVDLVHGRAPAPAP
jgi:hypothetical protein